MSVQASSWVIKHSKQKGSALLVLLMIANHAHSDGSNAFPSVKTLAEECRMSERQITRIIVQLEKSGELIIKKSRGRVVNHYAINMNANPDKMTPLNPDKLSPLKKANPDKSRRPTLTNPAFPIYKDEPLKEKREREKKNALSVDEVLRREKTLKNKESNYPTVKKTKAIEIYESIFPNHQLTDKNFQSFAERLPSLANEKLWTKILMDWRDTPGWKNSNFVGMIDKYNRELERKPKEAFTPQIDLDLTRRNHQIEMERRKKALEGR